MIYFFQGQYKLSVDRSFIDRLLNKKCCQLQRSIDLPVDFREDYHSSSKPDEHPGDVGGISSSNIKIPLAY